MEQYVINNNKYEDNIIKIPSNGIIIKLNHFHLADINSDKSDDIKTFLQSLLNNPNVKEYLKKYLTIEKIIIGYINMKPEQIMKNQNFINQIGAGNTSNQSHLNQRINLLADDSTSDLIGGRRNLFMHNKNLNNNNLSESGSGSESESGSDSTISNNAINHMTNRFNSMDMQNGGKSHKSDDSLDSDKSTGSDSDSGSDLKQSKRSKSKKSKRSKKSSKSKITIF